MQLHIKLFGASQNTMATRIRRAISTLGLAWLVLYPSSTLAAGNLQLTEEELKQYDGTDPEKPIYLAIDGTIFDVSASPIFYGPGGHYHHFTGKDASRAWVTECWDSEDQLTWRMDGIEEMFIPKYLDESVEQTADGKADIEGAEAYGMDEMARMAKVLIEKLGKVSPKEIKKRRKRDAEEAKQSVEDKLTHWINFFGNNQKYSVVGKVIHDKDKPAAPPICEAAMKKRPMKGGKLDDIMARAGKAGIFSGEKQAPAEEMPEFVNEYLHSKAGGAAKTMGHASNDDDEDLVRDEL